MTPFFFARRRTLLLALCALFTVAAAARLYNLDSPGVLVDRDYTSAIFARDYFFQAAGSIEPWRKDVAAITRRNQPILEPPITEWLTGSLYRATSSEDLRLARALTSFFWLAGGIAFFRIARSLVSTDAAFLATAYYLLSPMGILVSRSFQADSLMMLLFLVSLLAVVRYYERPSSRLLLLAAAISGITLLYRPLVLFGLLGAFTAAAVNRNGLRKGILDPRFLLFVGISLLPALIYYGHATFIARHFGWKLASSFQPHLLLHVEFWRGWGHLVILAIGYSFLAASVLGGPLMRAGLPRAIVAGLAGGYCVFGLVFTMHIHTHGYYHAQLIPIVALTASQLGVTVLGTLRGALRRYWWVPAAAVGMVATYAGATELRGELRKPVLFETQAAARRIGEIVHHSSRVAFLARYYGMPLQYYGELSGAYWPRSLTYYLHPREGDRPLSIEERLDALPFVPEYFVITAMEEFRKNHADLQQYLETQCRPVALTSDYLVYDACTSHTPPTSTHELIRSAGHALVD